MESSLHEAVVLGFSMTRGQFSLPMEDDPDWAAAPASTPAHTASPSVNADQTLQRLHFPQPGFDVQSGSQLTPSSQVPCDAGHACMQQAISSALRTASSSVIVDQTLQRLHFPQPGLDVQSGSQLASSAQVPCKVNRPSPARCGRIKLPVRPASPRTRLRSVFKCQTLHTMLSLVHPHLRIRPGSEPLVRSAGGACSMALSTLC